MFNKKRRRKRRSQNFFWISCTADSRWSAQGVYSKKPIWRKYPKEVRAELKYLKAKFGKKPAELLILVL